MPAAAYYARVSGTVQGIGYRWFVQKEAQQLDLSGWVRNLPNGDVDLEAEGEEKSLEKFFERLQSGHPWAQVESVEKRRIPAEGRQGFVIRH